MVFDAYDLADSSRYLSQLLAHAHQLGASDVHLESTHGALRVRLRVDGLLHEQPGPAPAIGEAVLSRIKILANLDIAERRLPQDGELAGHTLGKPQCSYRISTLPTIYGENLVVRVLDTQVQNLALDALGLQPEQAQQLRQEAQRQGVGTLREQARARVCEGLTSIDEALMQTPADDPP